MDTKQIEIEAPSIQDVYLKLSSQLPKGHFVIKESILSEGKPYTLVGIGENYNSALDDAIIKKRDKNDMIVGDIYTESESSIKSKELFSLNIETANQVLKEKIGAYESIVSITESEKGRKGVFGYFYKPNKYSVIIKTMYVVRVTFQGKAKIIFDYVESASKLGMILLDDTKKLINKITQLKERISYNIGVDDLMGNRGIHKNNDELIELEDECFLFYWTLGYILPPNMQNNDWKSLGLYFKAEAEQTLDNYKRSILHSFVDSRCNRDYYFVTRSIEKLNTGMGKILDIIANNISTEIILNHVNINDHSIKEIGTKIQEYIDKLKEEINSIQNIVPIFDENSNFIGIWALDQNIQPSLSSFAELFSLAEPTFNALSRLPVRRIKNHSTDVGNGVHFNEGIFIMIKDNKTPYEELCIPESNKAFILFDNNGICCLKSVPINDNRIKIPLINS